MTVIGTCPKASIGTHLVIRGTYKLHPKFGKQLQATSITEVLPSSVDGIEKYLSSGLIKGIGEKTAERLVREFGDKTLEIIYKEPERVAALPGIGKHKVALLHASLVEQRDIQEIMRFLIEHNVTQGIATKIFGRYGNRAIEVISNDPYLLAREVRGVGFTTADTIAMNIGLKPDSPQRLKAGLYYALEKATDDGHCFLPGEGLNEKTKVLLGVGDEYLGLLEEQLKSLIEEGFVVQEENRYYQRHLYKAEEFVANFVANRCQPLEAPASETKMVANSLSRAQTEMGIEFSPEQVEAVKCAATHRLLIITGGPGCGKTTIIRALTTMFRDAGKRLFLAAPTGRAAQRMSQICGINASTIHRLLKFNPKERRFLHGINDPLPADALIIDETSMLDIQLAKDLFSAVPKSCTLVLVGDKDQLPSVGPGRVFADLIALKDVKTVGLSRLFRRAEESRITIAAHSINAGVVPDIPEPDGLVKTDAYFVTRSDSQEAAQTIEKLVLDQIPKKFGFSRNDITVLTPTNRGDLGVENLNTRLQSVLNPSGSVDIEQELEINGNIFRIRDRVCQRVNNYNIDELGVFNGDIGEVYSVDKRSRSLVVELWDGRLVKYNTADISQLSLAYAVTVHRSQGSEIPCVILALHDSAYILLDRQLIYTAVTRAKKLLVVVGSKRALSIATKRLNTKKRYSYLKDRIESLTAGTSKLEP